MDKKAVVYKGSIPNHCCCDQALRILPDGEMVVLFMTGGNMEPEIQNHVCLSRSRDGEAWSEPQIVLQEENRAWLLSDALVTDDGRLVVVVHSHKGYFDYWETWLIESADGGVTWSEPTVFTSAPRRSFLRTLYRATWGESFWLIQSYDTVDAWEASPLKDGTFKTPFVSVIRTDGNLTQFSEPSNHIVPVTAWAECNLVELSDGRMSMLIRNDGSGHLIRSDSEDRGRTWSETYPTEIPNPGSKLRLHRLRDGRIILIHNPNGATSHPNSRHGMQCQRNPMAMWISDDDMKTWGYKRVLTDFPGHLAYPDGEVDANEEYVHFVFDYNRHDVIYWAAEIPPAGART